MGKAILIIDCTGMCVDCRFCRELDEGIEACCELCDEPNDSDMCRMIDVDYCQEKPDWCPLKELPEKRQHDLPECRLKIYDSGWNDCLDEILKGRD